MADLERKLYVGGLPLDIVQDELQEAFGVYGQLEEVLVLSAKTHERNDLTAFVKFVAKDEAAAALSVLNEMYKFRDTSTEPIRVSWARPAKGAGAGMQSAAALAGGEAAAAKLGLPPPPAPPAPPGGGRDPGGKLWVGNLPGDVSEEEMHKVFGSYGQVSEVNILPSKSRSGQLCGFVHFASRIQADRCIAAVAKGVVMRQGQSCDVRSHL
ncbi:unnamed protein product, partial [Polarella glacialis]